MWGCIKAPLGSRSKKAAKALADLGYTAIYDFGGITTWPYDIES